MRQIISPLDGIRSPFGARQGFSPVRLFGLNEPGIWLDPSDLTTMFQDRAGSTPVTTPGQSVGLRLDKSKGLVLGPELVTNGDFSGGSTGWNAQSGWTIGSGVASVNSSVAGSTYLRTSGFSAVAGTYYRVTFTVTSYTSGSVFAAAGTGSSTSSATAVGTYSFLVQAAGTGGVGVFGFGSTTVATIDNISVKELPGNHAVANSDAARGIYGVEPLGGRRNTLEQTNDFTVSPWAAAVLGTSTRANTTSPYSFGLGLVTVTSANGGIRQPRSGLTSGQPYALSFYLESAAANINVVFENGTAGFGAPHAASINPSTGAFSSVSGFTSTTSVVSGTGRIYTLVSAAAGGNLIANIEWRVTAASGTFLLGRPQFELGSTATAYQRVTDQYNVTEAGKQTLHYVQYDGSDDGYVTPTITPGIDKVQVFAGVRKLSDAATGIVLEASTSIGANNGSIQLAAPFSGANYTFQSRGTTQQAASYTNAAVAAPVTSVLTGIGDISADISRLRVNGVQVAENLVDQGTGNYLAYPLYIGRRGGASLPFNGRDYGIITRFGANLDASTIAATESWLNQKTGAY